jgi:hypothetical protein
MRTVWPLALSPSTRPAAAPRPLPTHTAGDSPAPILATAEAGVLTGRPELTETVLVPLLNELGQMQQQMAEQFQQALMMMFQLFSSMHQDQMALIREELAQIQRLNREQHALQAELAQQAARAAVAEAVAARTGTGIGTGAVESRPPLRLVSAAGTDGAAPAPPRPERAAETASLGGERPGRTPAAPSSTPTASRKEPTAAAVQESLHTLLAERLAAIQEERQGRWQKLLKTVMGRAAAEARP